MVSDPVNYLTNLHNGRTQWQWHQANPHCFHLLTMGTLHSLPSPVTRRSQKIFKPDFFRIREKELEARTGVEVTRRWIMGLEDDTVGRRRLGVI